MSFTVAARVRGPQPVEGATINPFSALNQLSEIQQRQQSMQLQQREMIGQQRLGLILNQAPTLQDGINAAMNDPMAAPYAADSIMRLQGALASQREITTSIGTEANNGHQAILAGLASSDDPTIALNNAMARFKLLSPEAQERERPAFNAVINGLTPPAGSTPQQAADYYNKNRASFGLELGWDADKMKDYAGIPRSFTQSITPASGGPPVQFQVTTPVAPGMPVTGPVALNPYSGQLEGPGNWTQPAPQAGTGAPSPVPPTTATGTAPPPAPIGGPGVSDTGELSTAGKASPILDSAPPLIDTAGANAPQQEGPAPTTTAPSQQGVVTPPAAGAAAPTTGAPPPAAGGAPAPGFVRGPIGQQTEEQKAFQAAEGTRKSTVFADTQKDMNATSDEIPKLTDTMDQIQNVVQQFVTGPGAQTRGNIASTILGWGSTIGMDTKEGSQLRTLANDLLGGHADSFADQQEFVALIRSYAVNQLKQAATGTGRVMLPEVEAFMKAIDVNMSPRALMQMINGQGRLVVQRAYDKTVKWNQFSQGVRDGSIRADIGDFQNWYTRTAGPAWRLPTKTDGGLDIGPRDPGTAMGTRPTSRVLNFNQRTGQFEPAPQAGGAPIAGPSPLPPPQNQLSPAQQLPQGP